MKGGKKRHRDLGGRRKPLNLIQHVWGRGRPAHVCRTPSVQINAFTLQMKFGVWPPLHTQHCHFPHLFNHGRKKITSFSNFLSMWGRLNPWSHFLIILLDSHPPRASHHFLKHVCEFSDSHSVHPTQSLVGLSRISVVDPTVSIHSSGIFLSAHSTLIIFWYENLRSLPTSSCIKSNFLSLAVKTVCHPSTAAFPQADTLLLPCLPRHPISSFQSHFSPAHGTSCLVQHRAPETTSQTWAVFFSIPFFLCC